MNNLSVKNLIEFRRFSDRRKTNFVYKLKTPIEDKAKSDGGNYWSRSIGALITAYKLNDNSIIKKRLELIEQDYQKSDRKQTKEMYQRNIDILYNFEEFDFSEVRPDEDLKFLQKPTSKSVINFNGIPVKILPSHVFSYGDKEVSYIGGVWFVVWLEGYKKSDLGVFCETIYRYLYKHYSNDFIIDPKDCIAVDALSAEVVTYKQVIEKEIPSLLNSTIVSINELRLR